MPIDERRGEDHLLAQRLGSHRGSRERGMATEIGAGAGFISQGVSAVTDPAPSEQKALEQAIKTARSIEIFGVAPQSLVEAMQEVAKQASAADAPLAWQTITYATPAASRVFATRGNATLGAVFQRWQSALFGIRNCTDQVIAASDQPTGRRVELNLLEISELYLEVVLITKENATERERLWVSVGPNTIRDEATYLVFDDDCELFDKITAVVRRLIGKSDTLISRQLEIDPAGLRELLDPADSAALPTLRPRSLQELGARPKAPPACPPRSSCCGRRQQEHRSSCSSGAPGSPTPTISTSCRC